MDRTLLHETATVDARVTFDTIAANTAGPTVERIDGDIGLAASHDVIVTIGPSLIADIPADTLIADRVASGTSRARAVESARPAVVDVRIDRGIAGLTALALAFTTLANRTGLARISAGTAVLRVGGDVRLAAVTDRLGGVTVTVGPPLLASGLVAFAAAALADHVPLGRERRLGALWADVPARSAVLVLHLEIVTELVGTSRPSRRARARGPLAYARALHADFGLVADDAASAAILVVGGGSLDLTPVLQEAVAIGVVRRAGQATSTGHAMGDAEEAREEVVVHG
ncbi:MAG: hypothetical protein K0S65_6825 [Labilithrix sp.]|nr:hypothetical protein [Labilithrix sp.]